MEQLPAILEAAAALLWPLLVLVVLFRFTPAVDAIIESAKDRKFTLKVAGQELTMEEVSEQQSALIADLQATVVAMIEASRIPRSENVVEPPLPTLGGPTVLEEPPSIARRVLWVDDQPRNNSFLVESLSREGVEFDLALSTSQGLARLERKDYAVVISDIGRSEDRGFNRDAGLEFLRAVRETHPSLPFAFFTSGRGVQSRGAEARAEGADLVTSSATELVGMLTNHLRRDQETGRRGTI